MSCAVFKRYPGSYKITKLDSWIYGGPLTLYLAAKYKLIWENKEAECCFKLTKQRLSHHTHLDEITLLPGYYDTWKKIANEGPWWWSSGQRSCFLLWQSEFESHWLLNFLYEKMKINEENARVGLSLKKDCKWTLDTDILTRTARCNSEFWTRALRRLVVCCSTSRAIDSNPLKQGSFFKVQRRRSSEPTGTRKATTVSLRTCPGPKIETNWVTRRWNVETVSRGHFICCCHDPTELSEKCSPGPNYKSELHL